MMEPTGRDYAVTKTDEQWRERWRRGRWASGAMNGLVLRFRATCGTKNQLRVSVVVRCEMQHPLP